MYKNKGEDRNSFSAMIFLIKLNKISKLKECSNYINGSQKDKNRKDNQHTC